MRSKLLIAAAAVLTGCASISTPDRAAQLEDDQLCRLAYDLYCLRNDQYFERIAA